jgi:hypothetical protein
MPCVALGLARTPAMQRDTLVDIIVVAAALVGIVGLIILMTWGPS